MGRACAPTMKMDCPTAHLLIEAFYDDELAPVEAATLLAHLGGCGPCKARHEAVGKFRDALKSGKPLDRCPEELKRRLARQLSSGSRRRRPAPPPWAITLVTAGSCLVGGYVAGRFQVSGAPTAALAALVSESPVTRRLEGEAFCLRCALERLFPDASFDATPHHPVFRTRDGRLLTLLGSHSHETWLRTKECSAHPVALTARVYAGSGLAEVLTEETAVSSPSH